MKALFFLFALLTPLSIFGAISNLAADTKCPVCRMEISQQPKTAYSTVRDEKGKKETVHLCSYSCAHAFHTAKPQGALDAHDFETGEAVGANDAWYVVKSKKIDVEVGFSMAPIIAAFKDEARAKAFQEKLKDGKVVHGLPAVESTYKK